MIHNFYKINISMEVDSYISCRQVPSGTFDPPTVTHPKRGKSYNETSKLDVLVNVSAIDRSGRTFENEPDYSFKYHVNHYRIILHDN